MIARIHIHPKVEKLLDQMEGLEKAPSIAAKRARVIIRSLVNGVRPSHAGRLSKRKDARIDNLFKFDLGSGYRLVCECLLRGPFTGRGHGRKVSGRIRAFHETRSQPGGA